MSDINTTPIPTKVAESPKTMADLLAERGKVHGDFTETARMAVLLKALCHSSESNWERMSPAQQEGLDMIMHKAARILCGDPNHRDHWDDIAGYAHIVSKRIGS
jgi:hypothetical protein